MYRNMLVLLDGSTLSEIVFGYAQQVAGRLKLDLELLHVCGADEADELPMRRAYMERMADLLRSKAEEVTTEAGVRTKGRLIHAQASVVVGDPAEEILKYIAEHKPDMVMMSTHGKSGGLTVGIGDVANRIVHAARVPVWLVPTRLSRHVIADTLPRRTLLIPLDGSRTAEAVLSHAVTIATQRGAESELVLLHVLDPARLPAYFEEEAALTKAKEYLDGIANEIVEAGFAAQVKVIHGEATAAITSFVKESPPQLLAIATHGHSELSKGVLSPVTRHILETVTESPILIVSSLSS